MKVFFCAIAASILMTGCMAPMLEEGQSGDADQSIGSIDGVIGEDSSVRRVAEVVDVLVLQDSLEVAGPKDDVAADTELDIQPDVLQENDKKTIVETETNDIDFEIDDTIEIVEVETQVDVQTDIAADEIGTEYLVDSVSEIEVSSDVETSDLADSATDVPSDAEMDTAYVEVVTEVGPDIVIAVDADVAQQPDKCLSLSCNDANLCTTDSCDQAIGCVYAKNKLPCEDGNACTDGDICVTGSCKAGITKNCDDGNVCTVDHCESAVGCVNNAAYVVFEPKDGYVYPSEWTFSEGFKQFKASINMQAYGTPWGIGAPNGTGESQSGKLNVGAIRTKLKIFGDIHLKFIWAHGADVNNGDVQMWAGVDKNGQIFGKLSGVLDGQGNWATVDTTLPVEVVTLVFTETIVGKALSGSNSWGPVTLAPVGCTPPPP